MGAVVVRVIATASAVLASGLTAALGGLGWCTGSGADAPGVLTVLVVADGPLTRVPTPRGSAAAPPPGPDVCIGSTRMLPSLIGHAERGATVLNADAPFTVLVQLIDQALRARIRGERPGPTAGDLRRHARESAALARLTAQEHEVLAALMAGISATEIASRTHRSLHTVRSHIKAVLAKLDVSSQTAAVAVAARSGTPAVVTADRAQFTTFGDDRHRSPPGR